MRWLCCHSLEEGIAERLQTIPPDVPRLDQQAIPHATIPDCASRLSLVSTVGKSAFDLACSIEGVQLFGREHEIQTAEIVLELRYLPCSNDGDYWHRLMAQPCERYLGHAATGPFGDRLHSRDDRRRALFLRKELLHSLIGQPRPVSLVHAGPSPLSPRCALLVSPPFASGDQASTPRFKAFAMGTSSRSTVRSIRLYSTCNPVNCVQPRSSARVFAWAIHQAGASEIPT